MIYKNSTAPVLLKKINLKVWSLKEELTHLIMSQIDSVEESELIKKLVEDYTPERPKLRLIKNEDSPELQSDDQTEASVEENQEEKKQEKQEEVTQKIIRLPEEKISQATTIMSEIYMDEIYFFSNSPFVEGQSIVINFCIPQNFIMNADVIFCQAYSSSNRVIGKGKLPFRVCARFSFIRKGEKTLLRKFLAAVEPDLSNIGSIGTKAQSNEDDILVSEDMFNNEDEQVDEAKETEVEAHEVEKGPNNNEEEE